jgi:hypothetical protein
LFVSRVCEHPSLFMMKMSSAPNRSLLNASLVPSGDQTGDRSCAGLCVMFLCSVPSGFMT